MPWQSGTYTRTNGTFTGAEVWQDDDNAGFGIEDTRHDTHDEDLAEGINDCINKNGENTPAANISMAGFLWTDMGAAANPGDALSKGTADSLYIAVDGSSTITADIPLNDKKLTGVATGTDPADAVNLGQLQSIDWAYIDSTGTVLGQSGLSAVGSTGTPGDWQFTWDNAATSAGSQSIVATAISIFAQHVTPPTDTTCRIRTVNFSNSITPTSLFVTRTYS